MICRIKVALVLAALVGASQIAMGRPVSPAHEKRARTAYSHPRAVRVRPIAIPQQIAPPQEAFASLPEKEPATPFVPSDCDVQLAKIAVVRPLGKLIGPGECGAPDAVLLESVILPDARKVVVMPPATFRCTMATQVAQWLREDVAPAAAKLGSPLLGLENLGSYECRGVDRVRGATLSEHGRANAIDVRAFKLADGTLLVLNDPEAPKDFRDAVRASACARFMTVLGPGADAAHAQHVHIDLAPRPNHYKICEWDVRGPAAATEVPPTAAEQVPLPRPRPSATGASNR